MNTVLKERVLEELKPEIPDEDKTKLMLLIEKRTGQPIEWSITPQVALPSPQMAAWLGISESLLSKWRKRLGIVDVRVMPRGRKANDAA